MCHLLLFFHVRPADQPATTGVVFCHEKFGDPCITASDKWATCFSNLLRSVRKGFAVQ